MSTSGSSVPNHSAVHASDGTDPRAPAADCGACRHVAAPVTFPWLHPIYEEILLDLSDVGRAADAPPSPQRVIGRHPNITIYQFKMVIAIITVLLERASRPTRIEKGENYQ